MSKAVQLYDKDGNPAYPRPYYRIGDFLESTNPNNPEDDGYIGTWELYGKGRVTVCIDPNDTDFDTIGKMSGEKSHTLTTDEIPSHGHTVNYSGGAGTSTGVTAMGTQLGESASIVQKTGGGQAHNNMSPYIVIYRWRRIA